MLNGILEFCFVFPSSPCHRGASGAVLSSGWKASNQRENVVGTGQTRERGGGRENEQNADGELLAGGGEWKSGGGGPVGPPKRGSIDTSLQFSI